MSRIRVWPIEFLGPGDSFVFPTRMLESARVQAFYVRRRFPDRVFTILRDGLTVRMWRIDGVVFDDKIMIDHNVPIPLRDHSQSLYPLRYMDVGDSFVIDHFRAMELASQMASRLKRKRVAEFTIKRISDMQWRCWRVK